MSFMITIYFIPFYTTVYMVYSISDIEYMQSNGFSNSLALSGSLLWSSYVTSTIRCSQLCQNDDRCISFNTKKLAYHKFVYELNWQYEINSTNLEQCKNCNYYYQVHIRYTTYGTNHLPVPLLFCNRKNKVLHLCKSKCTLSFSYNSNCVQSLLV